MSPALIPLALAGALLAAAAAAKIASPRRSAAALAWLAPAPRLRPPALAAILALEALLVVAVVLSVLGAIPVAPVIGAVAAFGLAGAALLARAIRAGRTGEPCGCLGASGRVGWGAVARAIGLAALALLALVPADPIAWLAVGVGLALLACAALGVVSLALAREVGELRISLAGDVALEIADEGPAIGFPAAGWPTEAFDASGPDGLQVAVFTSDGCSMCQRVAPAVDHLARDPKISVARFDEVADGPVWAALGVPGSPFAIVADRDGTPFAKGTFNSLAQLESVVATAARRRAEHMKGERSA